ncbi:hypothetical protein B1756_04125 [Natrarchaeobaculum aegyptiacum]|uniref:Uncharacterized protein n=1 Tax=Natrarchaeobaculum aegyptiacum TaxID=745377 RepID=A0A2Z2HPQ1_9EURY|nr:hypothetical protein B1756_04125 [Natrarchaeobaculum aegyptiacum]
MAGPSALRKRTASEPQYLVDQHQLGAVLDPLVLERDQFVDDATLSADDPFRALRGQVVEARVGWGGRDTNGVSASRMRTENGMTVSGESRVGLNGAGASSTNDTSAILGSHSS